MENIGQSLYDNLKIPSTGQKRLIIIGGGFAGMELARRLKDEPIQVVLIDKNNYHTFQPLLYQVATGALEPDSIAYPLRRIVRKGKNLFYRMAEMKKIHVEKQLVETTIGTIEYDYLVLAMGSRSNFYNLESEREKFMPMKTIPDALNLRSYILQNLESALLADSQDKEELMNIIIVGGGPTGVELAGALAEMKNYIFPSDYPELDLSRMRILLFDRGPRLLKAMSEEASTKAYKYLEEMGVQIHLNSGVDRYSGSQVFYEEDKCVRADTVIWAAGVKGALMPGLDNASVMGGRLKVDAYHKIEGHDSIYAIGDVAIMITEEYQRGVPMLASAAKQQGKHLARNIIRSLKGHEMIEFSYNNKGVMATIGRKRAVVDLPRVKFQGTFAWIVWMIVHIFSLVGFRNRFVIFADWVWSYFNCDKALRIIIRPYKRNLDFSQNRNT